ncbi:MAG: hypothetical protein EOO68_41015, partial [Moraxellaceae bacterium]
STVRVYDANNKQVGSSSVYSDGQFSFYFYDATYLKSQQLTVTVTDRAGNVSASSTITPPADIIAPAAPDNLELVEEMFEQVLSGSAEAYSTVKVYDSNNTLLGSDSTDSQGNFSVYLNQLYLQGQLLTVTTTDQAGNVSTASTITAPIDNTAPTAPSQMVFGNSDYYVQILTGQAEAYSTIDVYDSANTQVASRFANSEGNFTIDLYKSYLKGEVLTLTATDQAGNISAASKVTAPLDTIAPSKPTDLVVSEDGQRLSGNAEAYTTIRLYDASNTIAQVM